MTPEALLKTLGVRVVFLPEQEFPQGVVLRQLYLRMGLKYQLSLMQHVCRYYWFPEQVSAFPHQPEVEHLIAQPRYQEAALARGYISQDGKIPFRGPHYDWENHDLPEPWLEPPDPWEW